VTPDQTAKARATDPLTSHEAAWSVQDISEKQTRVLELLRRLSIATDEDLRAAYIAEYGPVAESTVRTRRGELEDMGAVVAVDSAGRTKGGGACQRFRTAHTTR
jgi:hypothetical protein